MGSLALEAQREREELKLKKIRQLAQIAHQREREEQLPILQQAIEIEKSEKSDKLSNGIVMFNVGNVYKHGWGLYIDLNKAKDWFAKAALRGHKKAKVQLDLLNQ